MARKILIGYDGTESAKRALQRAVDLRADGDEYTVISVTPIQAGGMRSGGRFKPGDTPVEHRAELIEARAELATHGIQAGVLEAHGDPGSTICDAAEHQASDMIVVGSRNLRGAQRLLLGSVSDRVVHHAPCDVLVAK